MTIAVDRPAAVESYAGPVGVERYGAYSFQAQPDDDRPLYRFRGRLGLDEDLPAAAGRYHLWSAYACPWAHRAALVVDLAGLGDAVSVSYVDGSRDARGWAFRTSNGPDPVEGFAFLRQAYELTEPGFDGHVSVPAVWDRSRRTIATNDYATLDVDLATRFDAYARDGQLLVPPHLAAEVHRLDRWLAPAVNHGVRTAVHDPQARAALHQAFRELDLRLGSSRFLLGDRVTLADVRLFVTLVRFDVTVNADRSVHPGLDSLPDLWAYARELFALPAFRRTTDVGAFAHAGATIPPWDTQVIRSL